MPLVVHFAACALLPVALLLWVRVDYGPWRRELMKRVALVAGSVALVSGLAFTHFKEITFFGRENKDLEVYLNPVYALHSLKKVAKASLGPDSKAPLQPIAGGGPGGRGDRTRSVLLPERLRSQDQPASGKAGRLEFHRSQFVWHRDR
jgi:lipid A ethanolaminephosphotransferase